MSVPPEVWEQIGQRFDNSSLVNLSSTSHSQRAIHSLETQRRQKWLEGTYARTRRPHRRYLTSFSDALEEVWMSAVRHDDPRELIAFLRDESPGDLTNETDILLGDILRALCDLRTGPLQPEGLHAPDNVIIREFPRIMRAIRRGVRPDPVTLMAALDEQIRNLETDMDNVFSRLNKRVGPPNPQHISEVRWGASMLRGLILEKLRVVEEMPL